MKILMISSEAVPYAKAGGLADVVSALSTTLAKLGHDIRIVMPRYNFIDLSAPKKTTLQTDFRLEVPLGYDFKTVTVFEGTLPDDTGVPVYFLDNRELLSRDGIYGNRKHPEYIDNPHRFALFNRSVFSLCKELNWIPDILHCHDWPTGLVPAILNTSEKDNGFQHTASVLTIHNLGYQGIFSKHDIHVTQLDRHNLLDPAIDGKETINFLQIGLMHSTALTTVSPTYAKEIQQPEHGFGMDTLLRRRSNELFGILNGIDYSEWSPEIDPYLPYTFSEHSLDNKRKLKRLLQEEAGLPVDDTVALIGMVSRLVEQKGFSELCGPEYGSLPWMCERLPVQFVILGTGAQWCEEELTRYTQQYKNLSAYVTFDNRLAHLIEAGSDFFLMPSRYEPCGLNQMYSLRYGTIPIVRKTGGLADTVSPFNPADGEGTGFLFDELNPHALFSVVEKAIAVWQEYPDHIDRMRVSGMQKRFSWDKSAEAYIQVYKKALSTL